MLPNCTKSLRTTRVYGSLGGFSGSDKRNVELSLANQKFVVLLGLGLVKKIV